ncbi:antibiotic biosynthesis monooxygenase [Kribbella sp. NBC_01245]|uniref:antibiotic biosynthesis monooxygenase n=1 Tax=Kribbella sp. NBC_01245 TaxID=2903578 RepID=UPI002E2B5DAE|nr:antibiotic biosynthesis monooxygenase [Kribbella sp. NBC_01245]
MYARSTTIMARPEAIDAGIAQVRDEVMPMLQDMAGCIGLSMLVDRRSGLCITTSAWESEDAMRASGGQVTPIRERIGEMLGGSPQVEEWEIAVLHRDHRAADGACVRATWTEVAPDDVDRGIDAYKMRVLPAMEDLEGFCSASLFVDRVTGRGVSSVTFDSQEAMHRNREAAAELRSKSSQEAGAEVLDVAEFELVLAHLRVPELI